MLAREQTRLRALWIVAALVAGCGGGGTPSPDEAWAPPPAPMFDANEVEFPPECSACADPYQSLIDENGEYTVVWREDS